MAPFMTKISTYDTTGTTQQIQASISSTSNNQERQTIDLNGTRQLLEGPQSIETTMMVAQLHQAQLQPRFLIRVQLNHTEIYIQVSTFNRASVSP